MIRLFRLLFEWFFPDYYDSPTASDLFLTQRERSIGIDWLMPVINILVGSLLLFYLVYNGPFSL